ncbi:MULTISPECIES: GFA family protein [unclassified Rhizobium]|uniref:GFA family protein n=1 Tax=unclassified Rhizobium TaxID=2613769 RepID=UPI001ADBF582|nr:MULTISPECIES: GFA family protein [unclassified Rhizobium]MBO9097931.1 GFA family protein [Rhizobium sp. L58/93]MBO9133286.1 GFA family protein [Rhizobium sp. B209b/85]MBO9168082.1 GFA family protein [Rhizobium sp. L245/93]MBO9184127.1 GFA family protein [Rhizobium sp. E27B/91]QXZ84338.1 GFA family protein [Rhizobium sp. K1/93]
MRDILTGGCQCGAIRFRVLGAISHQAICHCRMCQKAVGSISWPFFTVATDDLEWSRGLPASYRSSEAAERGFCSRCGTPLTFKAVGSDQIDISIGSLDNPAKVEPKGQHWTSSKVPWFDTQPHLPSISSTASPEEMLNRRPHQHPDHDTTEWPLP